MPAMKDQNGKTVLDGAASGAEALTRQNDREVDGATVTVDNDELKDMTPREGGAVAVPADSRFAALRYASAEERDKLVNLRYVGRKYAVGDGPDTDAVVDEGDAQTSSIMPVGNEHIDVVVPSTRNRAQVAAFLQTSVASGPITKEKLKEVAAQGGPHAGNLHMAGPSVHFVTNEVTPVPRLWADWLLKHESYAFAEDK